MAEFIPTDPNDLTKVDASPTKAFFVDIITKDIRIDEAILDLVDNSIDGAKRLRPGEEADYAGLFVDIIVNGNEFEIADNCGGIPLDIARKYAFKFGRASGFIPTDSSVGQFGIGMKRALFKMARNFSVRSVEPKYSYSLLVDVKSWAADDINWDFDIVDLESGNFAEAETKTVLRIDVLEPAVAQALANETFARLLSRDIRVRHLDAMRRSLAITVNGETIIPGNLQLKQGAIVSSLSRKYEDRVGASTLRTRLYVGVEESDRLRAGWYIFCNGRCILEADQTAVTGWSAAVDGGVSIPKYHGQFARFRGYAFLDAHDASILPWNTTKTGLDPETVSYRQLLPRLIEAARPVINFLNALDGENDLAPAERILSTGLAQTPTMALERLPGSLSFIYREPPERGPPMSNIKYRRLTSEVNQLKSAMGVATLPLLGERSFEFAYENLVEDE